MQSTEAESASDFGANSEATLPSVRSPQFTYSAAQSLLLADRRDGDLLRRYVETRSEEAFAELGRRYAGMVYATCLREIGDSTLAEDASQSVFLLLYRKAGTLQRSETIAGWLYAAARYVAKNLMKQERRRRMNEAQAAQTMATTEIADNNVLWERIEPHLHDALDRLKPADREAVLLRYVAEQSFAEVGGRLGVSENTTRMRVNRAVEKIQTHLRKVGITVSVGLLATLMEARAAQAAPVRVLQPLAELSALHVSAGNNAAIISAAFRPTPGHVLVRLLTSSWRSAVAAGGFFVLLIGIIIYRQTLPQRLSRSEQRQLFTSLGGIWKGTLEYADDVTLQHFTYPTTVTFRAQNQGDTLQYTAGYQGSASVDTTTIGIDSTTGGLAVSNGGPQSSHRLNGVGELVRMRSGDMAFQGHSFAMDADVRLWIVQNGNQLSLQEEYRKSGQARYQFRNRFTLSK